MMADYEGLEYLEPGFDPATLTVPRLRSILVSHDVNYPSAAKKPQLVQIFKDDILPRAKKIVSARARARRTSRGIIDADSQESTVTEESVEEEPEETMPPPPTPRRTGRKASSRLRSEDDEPELPVSRITRASRSPVKRTPRPSAKHARNSDTETGIDPEVQRTARTTRKSEALTPGAHVPTVKSEDSDDEPAVHPSKRRESAFTYDNPFQSGSSPPSDSRNAGGEGRRKSLGTTTSTRKSTPASRRKTEGPKANDDIHPPTSSKFEISVSELNKLKDMDENGVEISEEFTPEEQLEITQEIAANGVDVQRSKKQPKRGSNLTGPLWLLCITAFGGYAGWYRQEKQAVGYCGIGRDAKSIIPEGVEAPDWARLLVEPQCEPCPQHAYCSGNLQTECEVDYILKQHPLSLGGIVPIAPTCEPDGEKVRKVQMVTDKAIEELRERRAKFECGELTNEAGLPAPTVEIDAEELKAEVSMKRKKNMGATEFEELWASAIGEIKGKDEVVSGVDGTRILLSSNSLARLPFSCAIKRSFRLTLARYRGTIGSVIALLCLAVYALSAARSHKTIKDSIPHLVSLTLERLSNQATLHVQDPDSYPESWISIGQLRDDVLRNQHSLSKRENIWKRVRAIVEMNANIRSSQRESRSGEISRVWEWIGAVGGIESSEKRRKSGRVSWGIYDEASSPVSGTDGGPENVRKKWEEQRPVY